MISFTGVFAEGHTKKSPGRQGRELTTRVVGAGNGVISGIYIYFQFCRLFSRVGAQCRGYCKLKNPVGLLATQRGIV